jgi:arylsulfatase A-like enzyme
MRNVVLVTVDCLRADHVGYHGYDRNTTPFLDGLARKGTRFANAFANGPNTRHSVPSFLSSTYPLLFLDEAQSGRFHRGRKSIAEVLREHGYATAAVHSNPFVSKFYGYDRGFDHFNDFLLGQVEDEKKKTTLEKKAGEVLKGVKAVVGRKLPHEDGATVNKRAGVWLQNAERPFFLWLHYMDVHMPYVPPNEYLADLSLPSYSHVKKVWMGKKIDDAAMRENIPDDAVPDYVNLYDGCIRYVDDVIGELVQMVEQEAPKTVFAVSADHGEEFREHGNLGHHEKLYDELLHVPLFLYGDGVAQREVSQPVSLLGLTPTLLECAGVEKDPLMQGQSLLDGAEPFVLAEAWAGERVTAVRTGRWKFITGAGSRELYDIERDPQERDNLYGNAAQAGTAREFEHLVDCHVDEQTGERQRRETWLHKEKVRYALRKMKVP